jgi:hypothetical protein
MTTEKDGTTLLPCIGVDVVEPNGQGRRGRLRCEIGANLQFDTARMESYFFAQWKPVLYDALLVAAAVEFCDKIKRRPTAGWARNIDLRIPVHEPERWSHQCVAQALHDTLDFLTGDRWHISFCQRQHPESAPLQGRITLPGNVAAVIPFSDGLDSRAVAGIMAQKFGDTLVRVRLGSKAFDAGNQAHGRQPFTSVPYKVRSVEPGFAESTARSRGFKFALLSGLAACLAQAGCVIVPESGQGALGPTLAPVGQAYPDYRSHPLFTKRMEKFLKALLDYRVRFEFPQLWRTKGETLSQFVRECPEGPSSWASTWSCWQQNRHVSVDGRKRQCGICAACMLRRLSIHAAGLDEPKTVYVWEDLTVPTLDAGAAFGREKITGALREYAIAGTLHLDHLAALNHSSANERAVALAAFQLGQACGLPEPEARGRLNRMLRQHESEWKAFVGWLGPNSFIAGWTALAA